MKQQIILVRGLPGSGKTTYAKEYVRKNTDFAHVESDMWFETKDGYKFSMGELTSAHTWCVTQTETAARSGANVIVSNTFTMAAECAPYFVIADKYDLNMGIVDCCESYGSIHNVPDLTIEIMRDRRMVTEDVKNMFKGKDLSIFFNNPYEAYQFFSTYERVVYE